MKTIRHGVFETNSSSSHSITITNQSPTDPCSGDSTLISDRVFYPNRIRDLQDRSQNRAWITTGRTCLQKAAMLLLYIQSAVESCWEFHLSDDEWAVNERRELLEYAKGVISTKFNTFDSIKLDEYPSLDVGGSGDSNDPNPFEPIFKSIFATRKIDEFIRDVVMNDSVQLEDISKEY